MSDPAPQQDPEVAIVTHAVRRPYDRALAAAERIEARYPDLEVSVDLDLAEDLAIDGPRSLLDWLEHTVTLHLWDAAAEVVDPLAYMVLPSCQTTRTMVRRLEHAIATLRQDRATTGRPPS